MLKLIKQWPGACIAIILAFATWAHHDFEKPHLIGIDKANERTYVAYLQAIQFKNKVPIDTIEYMGKEYHDKEIAEKELKGFYRKCQSPFWLVKEAYIKEE